MELETALFGNTLLELLSALGVALAIILVALVIKRVVIRRIAVVAQRTSTRFDDALIKALERTRLWIIAVPALWFSTRALELPERLDNGLQAAASLAVLLQAGIWIAALLDFWIERSRQRAMDTTGSDSASLSALSFIGKLLLWSILLLMALDNLGVDITAMVAGLGVGGVAVALAVQNILGDLFASLSIVIDKPFVIGDFIIIDEYMGTVEHVGLKTTRLRSLGGEQLVFSNSDLLKSRLRNYKRMRERRIVFSFGILYETPADLLEAVPGTVRQLIEREQMVRFDRAHFASFGDSAYNFEVVYWMLDPDYNLYMDTQQRINLGIVRAFAERGIGFAYPTRTLHVASPVVVHAVQEPDRS